jgi:hypothetical protein
MDLVCPKCQGSMRTYERNGVHVDQCTECRGIFLDRGELERLVDAETAWHGEAPARQPAPHPQPSHTQQPQASLGAVVSEVLGQVRSSSSSSHGYGHKPRKKSLISELFG